MTERRFVFDLRETDDQIIHEIVHRAEDILGALPREVFEKGTNLTEEGVPVRKVFFILSGTVALERQSDAGELLMHHASTGRIIGILGAGEQTVAFFTSVATTDVEGVSLTVEQLNEVVEADSRVSLLVSTLFLRTLDRRLRRAETLHVEMAELADQLQMERSNLSKALTKLRETREEMAAQARFASLGELAAGVAHELNNPIAAIRRAADYFNEDIEALLNSCPAKEWRELALRSLRDSQNAQVRSTKEIRALKRQLSQILDDPSLTERLIIAGVFDLDLAKRIANSDNPDLGTIEQASAIGTNLRNLFTTSGRIVDLVDSLRSYARPDGDPVENVDLNSGVRDTLRLLSHRLDAVEVVVEYGTLPRLSCHPGQLDEVWTNLITNAVEAMTDEFEKLGGGAKESPHPEANSSGRRHSRGENAKKIGTLTITTEAPSADLIVATFRDTGPGIAPDVIEHIFEPHFTTKGGEVRFGMGVGLGLCRSIVENHGGTIRLENVDNPRGTLATVELPVKSGLETA